MFYFMFYCGSVAKLTSSFVAVPTKEKTSSIPAFRFHKIFGEFEVYKGFEMCEPREFNSESNYLR